MIIDSLKLSHYRGALRVSLVLNEKINVFIGANGAGKSTVLDAAAIALSWMVSRMRHANASGRPIHETHITNGKSVASLEMVVRDEIQRVEWRLVKSRTGHSAGEDKSSLSALSDYVKSWQVKIAETGEQINIPLFVYYPVNRAVLDIPLRIRDKHSFTLLTAYDEALTGGANFRRFFEWFREREDLENENIKYQNPPVPDPQLEAVRTALTQFMPEFTELTVRRNPLRMEVKKNGTRLQVDQLSDGEKCLMAMIGDLAKRLAIANPASRHPLGGEGVVLIDEVDLHLHPKWQRTIVSKLLEVFPGIQFMLSTHSPHVITHVRPDSLFLMNQTPEGMQIDQAIESYGKNVDQVLEELMGLETTRPDRVEAELRTLFQTIDAGDIDSANVQISHLRNDIGDDPELAKASGLIRRRAAIGR